MACGRLLQFGRVSSGDGAGEHAVPAAAGVNTQRDGAPARPHVRVSNLSGIRRKQ